MGEWHGILAASREAGCEAGGILEKTTRWAAALGMVLAAGAAMAQSVAAGTSAVPEKWESAPAGAEAPELAARCMGMPEAEVLRMISDAGSNGIVTRRPGDRAKPYLVATGRRVVCVRVSERGFPHLPLEAFEETISFEGMAPEQAGALRAALSAQLAARGAATALVKNDKGNATQLTYLFASDSPIRIYYQASFLRAGEFDENKYDAVFNVSGNMTVTSRGRPPERSKYLYTP